MAFHIGFGIEFCQFLRISLLTFEMMTSRRQSIKSAVGWLVGWFGLDDSLSVFQSIAGRLPERGRRRREKIEASRNVQTTPTSTYFKRNRPLPYYHPNCRTPWHWKFTPHHPTTPTSGIAVRVEHQFVNDVGFFQDTHLKR